MGNEKRQLLSNDNKIFSPTKSNAGDDLCSFRTCLQWMCVDQSNPWRASLSWSLFFLLTILVPMLSHFGLACAECDANLHRPYDTVLQLSLTIIATVSFLSLSKFVRKYGLRRFLNLDKLCYESEKVRLGYTAQLNRSLKLLALFVLPCFCAEGAYKIWWYSSGASQIPFLGNIYVSDAIACALELCSWLYRTSIFFLVCVLFRLICYLQILRLQDFAKVFQEASDVESVLKEHLRIRRHLRIISHRYRAFILSCLVIITASQLASLLNTTKPFADVSIYRTGELAVMTYFENNRAGITVFGFMLDRTSLHTIFMIELSLVLWLLGKTVGIS
ncbi:hypothetical protein ACHQM5_002693 [Ranunculus cassubicifolius]